MSRKNRIVNVIKSVMFAEMAANGTASGVAGRARTIQSGKDKARDPRRQRRDFRSERWG